ncbi:MAG: DUF1553 domain-containing protein [Pirellulales bacterium]
MERLRIAITALLWCVAGVWLTAATGAVAAADDGDPSASADAAQADFTRHIQPIFAKRCYKCHGPAVHEAGLRLDRREAAVADLESGETAIVPGKADASAVLQRISESDADLRMPPEGEGKPLTADEIATIRRWIDDGAKWSQHWAFTAPTRPAEPKPRDAAWVRNPIDAFILHRLEAAGLKPAPPADKLALLRRAYYDLTGLPPTPEDVDAFLADESENAYEKVVDRLLDSPHYGEKWARHWLDLVRYAETDGYERDNPKENVWKYRDYVIAAFNDDKPYDRFAIEQLAGDELEPPTAESITATGFYRLGLWDDEPVDREQAYYDGLNDIIVTSGETFLGLTIGCARCHDHKLDPIPQTDYYQMLAFFHNLQHGNTQRDIGSDEARKKHAELEREHGAELARLRERIATIENRIYETFSNPEKEDAKDERVRRRMIAERRGRVLAKDELREYLALKEEERRASRTKLQPLDKALAAQERGDRAPDTFVLMRGNAHAQGDKVEPGVPQAIAVGKLDVPELGRNGSSGRRLALARWIASPENPMTARVMVNRIWQFHFGRGIVRSSSDFGYQGTPPTHPQLLNWLAAEFVERGWSMKSMHKLIMMSSVYRMSSAGVEAALAKDPTNELFWRFDMRRLTAEEVRDSILAASGELNSKMFGQSIFPPLPDEVLATASRPGAGWNTSSPEESARRSIYVHVKRSLRHPMLQNFDAPDTDTSCAVRVSTTVPTQALGMLNSRFIGEQADKLAERLESERPDGLAAKVIHAIRLTTGRTPDDAEVNGDVAFIESLQSEEGMSAEKALRQYSLLILNTNEFVYLD